jgi:hypothetical protein
MRRRLGVSLVACGILVCSCGHSIESPPINPSWLTPVTASASLVVTGDSVFSSLTVKNTGTTTQRVEFAPCTFHGPLSLRAYRSSAISGPAWDSALDDNAGCFTSLEFVDMKPGASYTFRQVNDVNEILGDSLPSGSYVLTVSGRYLTPTATTELANATLALTKHAVAVATVSFTTDNTVYAATASGSAPFIQYTFTVIARYANIGTTPVTLENACGPHPTWNIWGVGNNVGISPYDPESLCLVPTPPVTVAAGTVRFDTIQFRGPTTTAADGTPFGPLYGQFRITYRAGAGCNTTSPPCVSQPSNVFAIQLPQ